MPSSPLSYRSSSSKPPSSGMLDTTSCCRLPQPPGPLCACHMSQSSQSACSSAYPFVQETQDKFLAAVGKYMLQRGAESFGPLS